MTDELKIILFSINENNIKDTYYYVLLLSYKKLSNIITLFLFIYII